MKPLILDANQFNWQLVGDMKTILRGYKPLTAFNEHERQLMLNLLTHLQAEFIDQYPDKEGS